MNKTKPVENWEENFREKFFEQFHGYEAKNSEGSIIWRYDTDNPWELLSFIMMFFRNLLQEQAEHFMKLGEEVEKTKNQAYYERNQLVLALSKLYPSWMELHPIEDKKWEKDWRHIVFIEIPTFTGAMVQGHFLKNFKQLSWHIHDSEVKYFSHLEFKKGNSWDGHTTEEKYERLLKLRPEEFFK